MQSRCCCRRRVDQKKWPRERPNWKQWCSWKCCWVISCADGCLCEDNMVMAVGNPHLLGWIGFVFCLVIYYRQAIYLGLWQLNLKAYLDTIGTGFFVKKVRCVEKCRRIYHAKMFLIIKINAKVLTQLQTNTKSNKDRRWKNKRIVVSIAPKNNPESPPEQTAKAFFLQRTTKHQHTARPNKILLCQCKQGNREKTAWD